MAPLSPLAAPTPWGGIHEWQKAEQEDWYTDWWSKRFSVRALSLSVVTKREQTPPGPVLPLGELGGCLRRWAKGGDKNDQKIQLCSGNDQRTPSQSELTKWKRIEHTFTQFMRRYRYYTTSGLVQKNYSYQFQFRICYASATYKFYSCNKLFSCQTNVLFFIMYNMTIYIE